MNEDTLLDKVSVEQLLAKLCPADRTLLLLVYEIRFPKDWGSRLCTFTNIGAYIGLKFEGKALSESAIRYRRDVLLQMLRGERGELRRPLRKPRG